MKKVEIYTDGACNGQKNGGIGVILKFATHNGGIASREIAKGYYAPTTNNRMELRAVIEGLSELKESCEVTLFTDSQYVQKGITEWIESWKKNGWKTAAKKPVLNQDLWIQLDELNQKHKIQWQWVKGHADNEFNNLCDKLAVSAAKSPTLPDDQGEMIEKLNNEQAQYYDGARVKPEPNCYVLCLDKTTNTEPNAKIKNSGFEILYYDTASDSLRDCDGHYMDLEDYYWWHLPVLK